MPLYDFKCLTCGHADEEFFKIDHPPRCVCPKCAAHTYEQQVSVGRARNAEFHTPIELHSIACLSMEEIREMQRAGVTISDNPDDELFGVPIAKTRQEKLKALSVAGFQEIK